MPGSPGAAVYGLFDENPVALKSSDGKPLPPVGNDTVVPPPPVV